MHDSKRFFLGLALSCAVCGTALAQVTVKPDGRWRHLLSAGASIASGNSDATSLNLSSDSVRATSSDKWSIAGRVLYSRNEGDTTAERFGLGTQYNRDLSQRWFVFGTADALRDRPANLSSRLSVGVGPGYHLRKSDAGYWDVWAGVGYTRDRYLQATEIGGRTRERYGHAELLFAEESSYKLTETTAFKQKLRVRPDLEDRGEYRADFDANLTVAINSRIDLTAGLSYRYDSAPGEDIKPGDALFVTGLSVHID